jgi:hypothetical protein
MNTAAVFQRFEAVPSEGVARCHSESSARFLRAFVASRCAVAQMAAAVVSWSAARFRSALTLRPKRQVASSSEWFLRGALPCRGVRGVPAFGVASHSSASPSNNSLEPTPVNKARFLCVGGGAAQLSRWAAQTFE